MAVAAEELETLFLYLGGHTLAVLPGVHLSFGCVDVGRAGARRWLLQGRAELLAGLSYIATEPERPVSLYALCSRVKDYKYMYL